MATNLVSNLGGTGDNADSIVQKALEMTVSNASRKDAYVYNNAKMMAATDIVGFFTVDEYKTPTGATRAENYTVTASGAQDDSRNPYQYTQQINGTTVGSSNTANAVKQAGGATQDYNAGKQLVEIVHEWEFQVERTGAMSIQSSTGSRRTGSLASYAATVSSNGAEVLNTSSAPVSPASVIPLADGNHYFSAGSNQGFGAPLFDQAITESAGKHMPDWDVILCPTSLRTSVSDALKMGQSQNRYNVDGGKKMVAQGVDRYNTDFGDFMVKESWIMDLAASSDIYVLDSSTLVKPTLRPLGPNNEVVSNSDGQLDEYVMECGFRPMNQSGIVHIRNLSLTGTRATAPRAAADVNRAVLRKS